MQKFRYESFYKELPQRLSLLRKKLDRPLTLTEKILGYHLDNVESAVLKRGSSFVLLRPDRVAMQDATAQMAILQFIMARKDQTAVPTSVHCDHLITASAGARKDLQEAEKQNNEVYKFLMSASAKFGIEFWKPGLGIIHQIVLENYAFPGGLMIGTDSHTPNAGGMGMAAVGVGGADAVDVMVGMPWEILYPKITGIKLTGKLNGWCSGKDIILKLLDILSVKGGTNRVMEYFGPGLKSLSCTAQATVTNMGAELGATCSLFPFHAAMSDYLRATGRADIAVAAETHNECLTADPEVESSPEKFYDDVIEIDLTNLEPYIVGPHSPDKARPISKFAEEIKKEGYPPTVGAALIGSCTNSSYEDLGRAASIIRQGLDHGIKAKCDLLISPGSVQVYDTTKRDGYLDTMESAGATILSNSCGPCIGQWKRMGASKGEPNSIISTFNRNFPARNDGNRSTLAFIGSPEITAAFALAGNFEFNPLSDSLEDSSGKKIKLSPPAADTLPRKGFVLFGTDKLDKPVSQQIDIQVNPDSERLQLLSPFERWDGKDFSGLPVLAKTKGKCTTDHISPAGVWLRFRGHLNNISNNMLCGAVNAFTDKTGQGKNIITGKNNIPYSDIARDYKKRDLGWIIVGDENYGEGSSREHAAMTPRFLGAKAVVTRSIARIHETNLKKQGVLVLTFKNPSDYEKILEDDKFSIHGLGSFSPGKDLQGELEHNDGSKDTIELSHTYNSEQIEWFKAGSALNALRGN